jgi:DNA-binding MarR family transcriptional regulator
MNSFSSKYKHDSTSSIGLSFVKVYNTWHRKIKEQLKTLNLTHPQYIVLASLGYLAQHQQEVNQVDLARQSEIDVMTVSTIVKNLEKQHLIIRQPSLQDTRAKVVTITEKGQIILNQALPLVESIDTNFFGSLGEQADLFNQMLLKLVTEAETL